MSRILPMAWAGFGSLLTIGLDHDQVALLAAIVIGCSAAIGEVYRNG